ncbi:CobW family GTP-binding protein [Chitinivibrio alkaliphilus]|uniref:Cobalamin synthesis protein P47K n=1 Tax=Chitinivibrio alkaliphilus ACht1 TaxID=1313304 RepID=U7D4Z2_9BACT|nr:GTP-binding protein [Chitinivibrio alkaliphilus]ERP31008.1 cobalamin synthesis protein P47K [Chitinivibrio alkaliphilus ACht1]
MKPRWYTWDGPAPLHKEKTPISCISGFLGAGKTTLLNRWLGENTHTKSAVIVNDVGAINIDAALIRHTSNSAPAFLKNVVELTSGCICCSLESELSAALFTLIHEYRPDHILIEASGVAEPRNIVASLHARNTRGRSIMELVEIHRMISIFSPRDLIDYWHASQRKRTIPLLHSDPRRPVIELLTAQIEYAHVAVLTKTESTPRSICDAAEKRIRMLAPHIDICHAQQGKTEGDIIFHHGKDTSLDTSWAPVQNNHPRHPVHHHSHTYGFQTLHYHSDRPMDIKQLSAYLRKGIPGLLRAKGMYWDVKDNIRVGILSLAGNILRMDFCGRWGGRKTHALHPPASPKENTGLWGERCQNMVFIGIDMDCTAIQERLDTFLTDPGT